MQEQVHMHVDVGFVDLGVLAETVLALHKRLSVEMNSGSSDESGEPESVWAQAGFQLRWVGIDASAFCCAKVLVIVEMMMQGAAAESVVQVHCASARGQLHSDLFWRRFEDHSLRAPVPLVELVRISWAQRVLLRWRLHAKLHSVNG